MAAQYDTFRTSNSMPVVGMMHYEGAPQWAVGHNGVNGTNSATDTGPLIAQLNSIWSAQSVAAYTVSGTDNKTELANQVLALMPGGNTTPTTTAIRRTRVATRALSKPLTTRRSRPRAGPTERPSLHSTAIKPRRGHISRSRCWRIIRTRATSQFTNLTLGIRASSLRGVVRGAGA
jgi:hypothetical protein